MRKFMFENIKSVALLEGINHLEDLSVEDFISKVENLSNLIVSEKLDGANLWMGFDLDGKFYTSRAGKKKGAKPFYTIDDYPTMSAYSGFKAAHLALDKISGKLSKFIKPGQAVEVEILFGRQPNAVTYGVDGKSYIAFIRPVEGEGDEMVSEDTIDELSKSLEGQDVKVFADILTSADGDKLQSEKVEITWQIVKTQTLDSKELKNVNVKKEIKALRDYLAASNEGASKLGMDLTNAAVLGISLTKVPKEKREEMKALRAAVGDEVLTKFKLPIKEKLLNDFVRKIKPKLQGTDLDDSEDTGVEGVVLRDPTTHEQFKIVDKDVFTTVNAFNWGIRASVDGTVKTDDPEADRAMRGGAVGEARIRIANLLGMRELAKSMTAKRFLSKFKGKNEFDTAQAVADSIQDLNFSSVKTKIRAILSAAKDEVRDMLATYKKEVDSYKVELKNGKTVRYSPEVRRRTLTAFAEVQSDLAKMIDGIDKAKNATGLILVLYGRTLKALFDDSMNESIIANGTNSDEILTEATAPDLDILTKMNADQIAMAYQATLFGHLLLLRAQDGKATRLLKDPTHAGLKKYSKSMSQLNFWGLVFFNPDNKEVKPHIEKSVYKQVWKTSHRFLSSRIKNIHAKLSNINNFIVDWEDQAENLRVVTLRLESRTNDVNTICHGLVHWPDLTLGEKETVVAKVFYQLTQHVPMSPLISRVREFANKVLLTANKDIDKPKDEIKMSDVKTVEKIKEDGESAAIAPSTGAGAPAETTPASGGFPMIASITNTSGVATVDKRLFKNKVITRRKRGYTAPKQFERPKSGDNA